MYPHNYTTHRVPRGRRLKALQVRNNVPLVVVTVEDSVDAAALLGIQREIRRTVGQCRLIVHDQRTSITVN